MLDIAKTSDLFTMYATSETDAENGKWFEFGNGLSFKIRRFKSKKSRKVREQLEAPYKRGFRTNFVLPDDVQEKVTSAHIAEGILADWKGLKDTAGKDIPYSPENALQLFEMLPEIKDAIAEISLNVDNYREEVKKDVEGN